MQLKNLAKQTAIYGISSIVVRLLNYMLTPYLTRELSISEYGVQVDLYALIPLMLTILTMGMESGYFRFVAKAENAEQKNNVFATLWQFTSFAALAFLSIVLLFNHQIASVMGYAHRAELIWMVGVIVALDVVSAIPFAKLRAQNKALKYVTLRSLSVVVNVVLCLFFYSGLPLLAQNGVLTSIYNETFGTGYYLVANMIASGVTLLFLLRGCWSGRFDSRLLRSVLLFSLPLLLSGVIGTANEYIDRQMIKFLMPEDVAWGALGIYGAVVKIGVIMILFTQMYRLAAEPFFLSNFKKEDFVETSAAAMKYFVMVSVMIFLTILLFLPLFEWLVGRDFREGLYILPVVLIGNMLSGVVLNLSFWYKQSGTTSYALYVTCTGLTVTVIFNFVLVPTMGYYGSAVARMISEGAMVAVSYYLNVKHYPTPYDLKSITMYILLGAILYGMSFLSDMLPNIMKYFCNLALLTTFVIFAIKKERIDVVKLVRAVIKK